MKKAILAIAAAATIVVGTLSAPTTADAQRRGFGLGLLGLGVGVVAGAAIANSWGPAYAAAPGYVAYPGYYVGPPVGCPGGYWARVPVVDPYGNVVGWRGRPRFFCP
jgi:hypothetical protein